MKLIPTDVVPKRSARHDLQGLIREFMDGDAEIVKVDFNETDYKSAHICVTCLRCAIKRSRRSIRVFRDGTDVYLSKL